MTLTKKQQELHARILDKLYTLGPISRIDIANQTGITPATVTEITGKLIQDGIVHEEGHENPEMVKFGRRKVLLDISGMNRYFIGSELSEKYVSFCLSDNLGQILAQEIKTFSNWQAAEKLTEKQYIADLQAFIEQNDKFPITAIGIALPGHFDDRHQTVISNHPFWKSFNLNLIKESFELPVYFENNVQCMTIMQRILGRQQTDENFILLHVSRGMFCSYMYQGALYGQHNFMVGEIGFMTVQPGGELCECGNRGCLQTYASEAAIIRKAKILYDLDSNSYLHQLTDNKENIRITDILQAYRLGDSGVTAILNNAIKYLAIALKNLGILIDSQKIYIHGEIFSEPTLFDQLNDRIHQNENYWRPENSQPIQLITYHEIDGARAASAFAIQNELLSFSR